MNRVRQWLFRAPVHFYRAGLGSLLGSRFLLLEHRGRRTGAVRRTVLEVADRIDGTPIVVSGFGEGSDWIRNLNADPNVDVAWGRRRFPARAVRLTPSETMQVFRHYARRHRRAATFLGRALGLSILEDPAGAADAPRVPLRAPIERRSPVRHTGVASTGWLLPTAPPTFAPTPSRDRPKKCGWRWRRLRWATTSTPMILR